MGRHNVLEYEQPNEIRWTAPQRWLRMSRGELARLSVSRSSDHHPRHSRIASMGRRCARYVVAIRARGHVYLYYCRSGERVPLSGPEGSPAFNRSYDRVHHRFEQPGSAPWGPHSAPPISSNYLRQANASIAGRAARKSAMADISSAGHAGNVPALESVKPVQNAKRRG
jgi:hypothetical protein